MEGRKRRLVKRWAVLGAVALGCAAGPARASTVTDLVREARQLEAAHEEDRAIHRYTDALELDPTCAPAYLGLAGATRGRRSASTRSPSSTSRPSTQRASGAHA